MVFTVVYKAERRIGDSVFEDLLVILDLSFMTVFLNELRTVHLFQVDIKMYLVLIPLFVLHVNHVFVKIL